MSLNAGGVLADAWMLAKRDRGVLLTLAGMFYFLPQLALQFFVPPLATPAGPPSAEQMLRGMETWLLDHAAELLVLQIWTLAGTAVVLAFYLARGTETVRDAIVRGFKLLPGFVLIELIGNLLVFIGFCLFILPGYYLLGRLLLAGPVYAAEARIGPIAALEDSVRRTHRHGFVCAGLGVLAIILGWLALMPIRAIGDALNGAPHANPVSETLIGAAIAAVSAAATLGGVLIRVALYRQLAAR